MATDREIREAARFVILGLLTLSDFEEWFWRGDHNEDSALSHEVSDLLAQAGGAVPEDVTLRVLSRVLIPEVLQRTWLSGEFVIEDERESTSVNVTDPGGLLVHA